MELIDRYVAEVGRHLPRKQRADIEAELRSLLIDNLEDRSEGQPTQEDVIDLLKEFGPPQKMAASYWPEGQYLIGPTLYPLFRMVAGIALLVVVIVQLVLLGVSLFFQAEVISVAEFAGNFIPTIVSVFGWVVLAFAIMQRLGVRPQLEEDVWHPRSLPPAGEPEHFSRTSTVVEIGFGLFFVVLLSMLPGQISEVLPSGVQIYISPILLDYLPLLVLSTALGVGLNVILLWRGRWETATRLGKIAVNLFGITVLALLIREHTAWLAERNASAFFTILERIPENGQFDPVDVQIISMQFYNIAFIIALLVTVVDTIRIGWLMAKGFFTGSGTPSLPVSSES